MQVKTAYISSSLVPSLSSYIILSGSTNPNEYFTINKIVCTLVNPTISYDFSEFSNIQLSSIDLGNFTGVSNLFLNNSSKSSTIISTNRETFTGSLLASIEGTSPSTGNSDIQFDVYYDTNYLNESAPIINFEGNVLVSQSLYATASNALKANTAAMQQFTNTNPWTFTHGLDRQDIVIQAYDLNYNQIIPKQVQLTDPNYATISFPDNQSGYAIATFGGISTYISGTFPSNTPVYTAVVNDQTGLSPAIDNQLTFTTVENDPSGLTTLDVTNTIINVGKSGYYNVSISSYFYFGGSPKDDEFILLLKVNGGSVRTAYANTRNQYGVVPLLNVILPLYVNDQLEFFASSTTNNYDIVKLDPIKSIEVSTLNITYLRSI